VLVNRITASGSSGALSSASPLPPREIKEMAPPAEVKKDVDFFAEFGI
jgi:hypothetical protein